MDNRPVGVFDSGLGGLTAVRAIQKLLPGQDILYLGDTARLPYGTKSPEVIIQYALEHMAFMLRRDVKALVVACGSMSTVALNALRARSPVPVLAVVEPSVVAAVKQTRNHHIGLIATAASVTSGTYQRRLKELSPEAVISAQSCPLFVPLVENGRVNVGDIVIETVAAEYLAPLREAQVDTLLLGCTHYPLLTDVIRGVMGENVTLIDSGAAVAEALAAHLTRTDALPEAGRVGTNHFFVTDTVSQFEALAALFLQNPTFGLVDRVDILSD